MDLSSLSSADLQAIQKGDMSSVSVAGLKAISGQKTVQSFDSDGQGNLNPTGSPAAHAAMSPTSGMSGFQQFAAGAGKAPYDLARGTGQLLGMESRQDVANSRAQDSDLMGTSAGKWGNLTGNVAQMIPAAFIPGANTLAGAAAIGAGTGLLQPSTSTGETAANVGLGGAAWPGGLLLGRGAGALYQGGKAAIEPLFAGGQQRIAARTMQAFAGGPNEAATAAGNIGSVGSMLPGISPTTAELANNAGISQLERSLQNNPEFMTALTNRRQANAATMKAAVGGIAGTDAQMTAAQQARAAATKPLYEAAQNAQIKPDAALNEILSRPSASSAWNRAQQLAAENGTPLVHGVDMPASTATASLPQGLSGMGIAPTTSTVPASAATYSGRGIQYLKMAMNDIANSGPQNGMGAHEVNAVKGTMGRLNSWISDNVPALKSADATFADLSKPINQMEVGQQLSNKLVPALADFGNVPRLNANSYAGAVRNGDALAQNATGWKGSTLANTLSPDQMQTVNQVGEQLARQANASDLGRAIGSNTAQNLVSQNIMRQFLGPLGMPQGLMERAAQSTLGQTLGRPAQWAGKLGEQGIMNQLTEAALNPSKAQQLLQQLPPKAAANLWRLQGLLSNPASMGARGLLNPPEQ